MTRLSPRQVRQALLAFSEYFSKRERPSLHLHCTWGILLWGDGVQKWGSYVLFIATEKIMSSWQKTRLKNQGAVVSGLNPRTGSLSLPGTIMYPKCAQVPKWKTGKEMPNSQRGPKSINLMRQLLFLLTTSSSIHCQGSTSGNNI